MITENRHARQSWGSVHVVVRWLLALLILGSAWFGLHRSSVAALERDGNGPRLEIPAQMRVTSNSSLTVPIEFRTGGHAISSLIFSIDYDASRLIFDPTDHDADGIPDAVTLFLPAGFNASVTYDAGDTDGELDFFIADTFPPLGALPGGPVATVVFSTTTPATTTVAAISFSDDPVASFGNTEGQSVPGSTSGGSARICVLPVDGEDLNCDGATDLLDLQIAAGLWSFLYTGFDVDGDGDIDIRDLQQVLRAWPAPASRQSQ